MYTPDRWAIVKATINGGVGYRVMGSWYGGYLGANSWRISSGISAYEDCGDYYLFHNQSGSVYTCHKSSEGMSSLASGALQSMIANTSEYEVDLQVIDIARFLDEFEGDCNHEA